MSTESTSPVKKLRSPIDRFQWSMLRMQRVFHIAGQDIFRNHFHYAGWFYVLTGVWLVAIAFEVFTLLDIEHCVGVTRYICIMLTGGSVQFLFKYIWIPKLQPLVAILEYYGNIYRNNSRATDKYYRICNRTARIMEHVLRATLAAYFGFAAFVHVFNLLDALLMGKREPLTQFYLPRIYEYSGWLYVLVTIYDIGIMINAMMTVMPADLLFFMVTANVSMASVIVQQDMDEFSAKLQTFTMKHVDIPRQFIDYIEKHQRFNADIRVIDECFRNFCIVQFVGATFMLIFDVSLATTDAYAYSIAFFMFGMSEILAYCVLGTLIQNTGSEFYDALYSLDWYSLPVQHQKTYRFLLEIAQRPQIFYLANVKPVNMETFLQTMRIIYSSGMVFAAMI